MNLFLQRSRPARPRRRSTPALVIACVCCGLVALMPTSCRSGDADTSPGTGAGGGVGSTETDIHEMSPAALGDVIGATWTEAVQEVAALLENQPDTSAVKTQLRELKDSYVTELLALGRVREALSETDKAIVDKQTEAALEAAADEPWYLSYVDIYNSYPEDDLDFKLLLVSFNILTQYANFDLLKLENPEEAARLGIE